MALLHGRAGRLTAQNGGSRLGRAIKLAIFNKDLSLFVSETLYPSARAVLRSPRPADFSAMAIDLPADIRTNEDLLLLFKVRALTRTSRLASL
jgi:hypothetical protein